MTNDDQIERKLGGAQEFNRILFQRRPVLKRGVHCGICRVGLEKGQEYVYGERFYCATCAKAILKDMIKHCTNLLGVNAYAEEQLECPRCGGGDIKITGVGEVYLEYHFERGEFVDSDTGDNYGFLDTADHRCYDCGHEWTTT